MTDITITATRNPNNDMTWDEDSQEYIPSPTPTSNPTVRELEANGVVYDIVAKDLENADYVVEWQAPTSENNYTWYRLYKSGWIEQGGMFDAGADKTASSPYSITLPVEMNNTDYYSSVCMGGNTNGGGFGAYTSINTPSKTTTSIDFYVWKTETSYRYIYWEVKGMSVQR